MIQFKLNVQNGQYTERKNRLAFDKTGNMREEGRWE